MSNLGSGNISCQVEISFEVCSLSMKICKKERSERVNPAVAPIVLSSTGPCQLGTRLHVLRRRWKGGLEEEDGVETTLLSR